jgi:hypothetical protein
MSLFFDYAAPHKHLVVDATDARMNYIVAAVNAPRHIPVTLAIAAEHAQRGIYLHIASSLGTPSIMPMRDYHPFALEVGERLATMAVELFGRLAISEAVRQFLAWLLVLPTLCVPIIMFV